MEYSARGGRNAALRYATEPRSLSKSKLDPALCSFGTSELRSQARERGSEASSPPRSQQRIREGGLAASLAAWNPISCVTGLVSNLSPLSKKPEGQSA